MADSGHMGGFGLIAGRLIVGGVYLGAGIENLMLLEAKAGYTASKGVANASFWVIAASILLLVGATSILTGIRPRLGVAALALFLVPVTLIMHNFWALDGIQATIERHAFMGNLGLFGSALLLLAIRQPWAFSLDEWVVARVEMLRRLRERVALQPNAPADA